jgi:hypothetical protein
MKKLALMGLEDQAAAVVARMARKKVPAWVGIL